MDHLKKILVAIDFSLCGAAALRQAVRLAARTGAAVKAVHVMEMPIYAAPDFATIAPNFDFPPMDLMLAGARERWSKWPTAKEVGAGVTFEAVLGYPRLEILDRVAREKVDLLVVGAHGESDSGRGLGSIAAACVQRAGTRVLVVRQGQGDAFRSVAACIDFSETSRLALEQAIAVAAQDNAALHIVNVYDDPWRGFSPPEELAERIPDLAAQYHRAVEKQLRAFCEPMAHETGALKATFHAVQYYGHGKGLVDFVTRQRCDLVVLGTRAKWNLRDFVLGSTAERVLREAPCAALTVKPKGFEQG